MASPVSPYICVDGILYKISVGYKDNTNTDINCSLNQLDPNQYEAITAQAKTLLGHVAKAKPLRDVTEITFDDNGVHLKKGANPEPVVTFNEVNQLQEGQQQQVINTAELWATYKRQLKTAYQVEALRVSGTILAGAIGATLQVQHFAFSEGFRNAFVKFAQACQNYFAASPEGDFNTAKGKFKTAVEEELRSNIELNNKGEAEKRQVLILIQTKLLENIAVNQQQTASQELINFFGGITFNAQST